MVCSNGSHCNCGSWVVIIERIFLCGGETELLHGCSSVVAEDSAIRLGVQVACKKGLRNVVMESDSLECVLT